MDASTIPTWYGLRADYEEAKRREDAFAETYWNPLYEEERRRFPGSDHHNSARRAARMKWGEESGYEAATQFIEALQEHRCQLRDRLMTMPAPDKAALLWKLEHVFTPDDGEGPDASLPCWTLRYVQPTIDDFRRFLGDAQ